MSEFGTIDSSEQLERAIAFLSRGFKWTDSQVSTMRGGLLACNEGCHAYGAWSLADGGRINSAILFFYQGEVRSNGVTRSVIGTSSWYVEEANRGLEAIRFLNRAIDYLKSNYDIITNYSPNDIAIDLYGRLGFKYQTARRINLFTWNSMRFIAKHKLGSLAAEDRLEYAHGFGYLGALKKTAVKIRGTSVTMVIRVRTVERFNIPLRIVQVVWADSYQALGENINIIALKLCVREKAVVAQIYFNLTDCDESRAWLVFDPESEVTFISPVQSELTST